MAKTLTVYLAADLKKFNSGMKDAQGSVQGFGGTLKNNLGPALIAAGAAAGAFALKLGVDGVKAAMEDEKAVAALSATLQNLNLAHDTDAIEAYIYELERAYGIADTELRPAYDRLVRSTKDTQEANRALKIAMDISAGTGKSLQTIVDNLGRAYDGNVEGLSRLGLGIDRTALKTMSFDEVLGTLASTFAGQADANAKTFEGQMRRLETASDNLKEAFGAGLLGALGDTDDKTQDLVESMEELEPIIKEVGESFGESFNDVIYVVGLLTDLKDRVDDASQSLSGLSGVLDTVGGAAGRALNPLQFVRDIIGQLRGDMNGLRGSGSSAGETLSDFSDAAEETSETVGDARWAVDGAQGALQRMYASLVPVVEETDDYAGSSRSAAKEVDKLTKKQKELIESYNLQGIAFQTSKTELMDQIQQLEEATAAVESYASAIQGDLLSGFDLGELAGANLNEEGQLNAGQFFQGFDQAINQAEWFGNVLQAIKARGADQSLIEQLASLGPEVGGTLGQELLDKGLVPELLTKWNTVQSTTKDLALGLVPEFLEAGRLSAIDTLNGLATQFGEDQRKFKRLGNKLGQQVGQEFKARTLKEIADAVKQVEALATAARAEAVANAEREQARITEQAVASAIANLIRNSDQRTGRNVQPVLT